VSYWTGLAAPVVLALLAAAAACGGDDDGPTFTAAQGDAQLRAEAEEYCPPDGREECTERYIELSQNLFETALCVNDAGDWYFETPLGDRGEPCSIRGATIVAIVGGD
jgi:hypothetical protein